MDTNLCTGCAACVMACPRDVLDYRVADYQPVQIGAGMAVDERVHGDRGCDICTRACPRFLAWATEFDTELSGRVRKAGETHGIARSLLLAGARDTETFAAGQDGGLLSAHDVLGRRCRAAEVVRFAAAHTAALLARFIDVIVGRTENEMPGGVEVRRPSRQPASTRTLPDGSRSVS